MEYLGRYIHFVASQPHSYIRTKLNNISFLVFTDDCIIFCIATKARENKYILDHYFHVLDQSINNQKSAIDSLLELKNCIKSIDSEHSSSSKRGIHWLLPWCHVLDRQPSREDFTKIKGKSNQCLASWKAGNLSVVRLFFLNQI